MTIDTAEAPATTSVFCDGHTYHCPHCGNRFLLSCFRANGCTPPVTQVGPCDGCKAISGDTYAPIVVWKREA